MPRGGVTRQRVVLSDLQSLCDCQQTPLSLSLLSHCLEHQTQPPTPVTPVSLLMSPYPLYRPPILPLPTPVLTSVILYRTPTVQYILHHTIDPKPQALDPTPLVRPYNLSLTPVL